MIILNGETLTISLVKHIARDGKKISIDPASMEAVKKTRLYVEDLVASKQVVYGITTGFGKFSDVVISGDEAIQLQKNLIISHACGIGSPLSEEVTRAIMLLRINNLIKGYSGVRPVIIDTLVAMVNKGVHPIIPEKGSLGASGDLAPLAHMVLVMIGLGEAIYKGKRLSGQEAMQTAGIPTVELREKEGLALINGTQVMTAIGCLNVYDAIQLMKHLDVSAAMTVEALNGIIDAFDPRLHMVRPHKGQVVTASNMLRILKDSKCVKRQGELRVQDAYTLRCIPQIHGASKDAIQFVAERLEIEINAVTDNPILFTEDGACFSGGNFHGQPMALPFDYLKVALAEMANVSERRIERLVNPQLSGLPAFLTPNGGLHSGFMIAQYAAASLVSENKVLAHPASVDSIPSSANQEDHVSMGTISARNGRDILENMKQVVGIELLAAAQAIDFRDAENLGVGTKIAYDIIRKQIPKIEQDRVMYLDFNEIYDIIMTNEIIEEIEAEIGELLMN
jgi:histidine ammonia-lyase